MTNKNKGVVESFANVFKNYKKVKDTMEKQKKTVKDILKNK
tara:strand:+ start:1610 stop:1732 length:123 start_codon:yes stop_codon:yes gene_type:complete